jgi:hypothetical protein
MSTIDAAVVLFMLAVSIGSTVYLFGDSAAWIGRAILILAGIAVVCVVVWILLGGLGPQRIGGSRPSAPRGSLKALDEAEKELARRRQEDETD